MNLLNDTLNDLKNDGANFDDIKRLETVALTKAFELLDPESQFELCEIIKSEQRSTWAHQESMNAQNRAVVGG